MNIKHLLITLCSGALTLNVSTNANAAFFSAEDTVDDAALLLTLEDTLTIGVNQQWGTLNIKVGGADQVLTVGDSVDLWLYEDDFFIDDLLWQESFTVSATDATAGFVDRTFALIFTTLGDASSFAEIYATALVTKTTCGLFCMQDNPRTAPLNITLVDASVVPVPAAVWLFGSGLVGLVGFARRKK